MGRSRTAIVAVVATVLAVGLTGSAFAGGKGGASKGTLTLVVLSSPTTSGTATSEPQHGSEITFEVSTTATDQPYVNVRCYQGDAFVYDGWAGFFPGAWFGQTFTLTSAYWTGGEADCTARLVMWARNGRERTLTTMGFHVLA